MGYCFNLHCPAPGLAGEGNFCIHCGHSLRLNDRYHGIKCLNSYGISGTFLAQDQGQNKCVIKKIPLQGSTLKVKSWEPEIKAMQLISSHPQIPDLWDHFFDPDHRFLFLVQDFIPGSSIDRHLHGVKEVEAFLLEALPLLSFIHNHGVVHRDLNPQNFIRSTRSPYLLYLVDLSTAKVSSKTALARTGTTIGSAAYAAPEQLQGKAYPGSDLYSLGLIAIHLLTHMNPLELLGGADGITAWRDYLTEPISPNLIKAINGMVAESLTDRYDNAQDVMQVLNPDLNSHRNGKVPLSAPAREVTIKPGWKERKTWQGHGNTVTSLNFSDDGTQLLSTGADQLVKVWDWESLKVQTLTGHRSVVSQGLFAPGQVISSSWDYGINLWPCDRCDDPIELQGHNGWVLALALTKDGALLASGGSDRLIKLWDLSQHQELTTLQGHQQSIQNLVFCPNHPYLVSGDQSGCIKIWHRETYELIASLDHLHQGALRGMKGHPRNPWIISGGEDHTIKLWQVPTGQIIQSLSGHFGAVIDLALDEPGNLLASICDDHKVNLWHLPQGQMMESIAMNTNPAGLTAIALHPQGTKFAIGYQHGSIALWDYH